MYKNEQFETLFQQSHTIAWFNEQMLILKWKNLMINIFVLLFWLTIWTLKHQSDFVLKRTDKVSGVKTLKSEAVP